MRRFEKLTLSEFSDFVRLFHWTRRVTEVHLHHTWRPRRVEDRGESTIEAMWRYHTEVKGWSDIAQHVTIGADGEIWLGRNFNWSPASARGFNGNSVAGPFMIEMIGDFDIGRETLSPEQKKAAVAVIKTVQSKFVLPPATLRFHNEMSAKTCPGTSQDKAEWIRAIEKTPGPDGSLAGNARGAFDDSATHVFEIGRTMLSSDPQPDDMSDAEHDPGAITDSLSERDDGGRGLFGGIDPGIPAELADHVVNLSHGRFSRSGILSSDETDVDRIFGECLPAEIEAARVQGRPARLLLYAHGGLVSESNAVRGAWDLLRFWQANDIYPLFFVWETGFAETLKAMLLGSLGFSARELAARGFLDRITDRTDRFIEDRAHEIGRPIWSGMKRNAERAHDSEGAGTYVARKLHELIKRYKDDAGAVEVHMAGHSAGAIFLTHFLATLHKDVAVKSAHFLAPAISNESFKESFAPAVDGKRVGKLHVFTMKKVHELNDTTTPLYRKSLLYLIHHGLESERATEILGLEESLRRDAETAKLFGLSGTPNKNAEVVWSKSDTGDCSRSSATRHSDFDNNGPTLESVCRIIAGKCNGGDIVGYEPRQARGGDLWSLDSFGTMSTPAIAQTDDAAPFVTAVSGSAVSMGLARGKRRALCIGIDKYQAITPLGGCVNDKNNWSRALYEAGFEIFADLENQDATAERITKTLRDFVATGRPGDHLVLQFAGHGTRFRDTSGDEMFDSCFCAVDCDTDSALGGLVIDDTIYDILGGLQPEVRFTLFTDCCHSGTVARAINAPPPPPPGAGWRARYVAPTPRMSTAYQVASAARARNVALDAQVRGVLFAACQDEELAWESGGSGNFTRIAVRELASAQGLSNRQFHDRVIKAFGNDRRQTPNLYCRPEDLDAPFGIV